MKVVGNKSATLMARMVKIVSYFVVLSSLNWTEYATVKAIGGWYKLISFGLLEFIKPASNLWWYRPIDIVESILRLFDVNTLGQLVVASIVSSVTAFVFCKAYNLVAKAVHKKKAMKLDKMFDNIFKSDAETAVANR